MSSRNICPSRWTDGDLLRKAHHLAANHTREDILTRVLISAERLSRLILADAPPVILDTDAKLLRMRLTALEMMTKSAKGGEDQDGERWDGLS